MRGRARLSLSPGPSAAAAAAAAAALAPAAAGGCSAATGAGAAAGLAAAPALAFLLNPNFFRGITSASTALICSLRVDKKETADARDFALSKAQSSSNH